MKKVKSNIFAVLDSLTGEGIKFDPVANLRNGDRLVTDYANLEYRVLSKKGGIRARGIIKLSEHTQQLEDSSSSSADSP